LLFILIGCVAPINTTFESAKLLNKGGIELQGSYSKYRFIEDVEESISANANYGVAIGYGVSDRYSIKLRYEKVNSSFGNLDIDEGEEGLSDAFDYNYIEFTNKFSLWEDRIAFSIPISAYLNDIQSFYQIDPRFFFTFGQGDHFDFTIIPKAHFIFFDGDTYVTPALSLGIGLSSDLSKWAIRPEVGFDSYFVYGIGFSYYLNNKEKNSNRY
tara:strand:- start:2430 stop:3068 length:639 start_codon:yes stop_codon:yes gene_type:complete